MGLLDHSYLWCIIFYVTKDIEYMLCRYTFSNWSLVFSGIPEGSVLGPLLFIVSINDLPDMVQSSLWLFVDDSI